MLEHEVIKHSTEPRAVLIVGVPRPLPLVLRLINATVRWGLAAPVYAKVVVGKADQYSGDLVSER